MGRLGHRPPSTSLLAPYAAISPLQLFKIISRQKRPPFTSTKQKLGTSVYAFFDSDSEDVISIKTVGPSLIIPSPNAQPPPPPSIPWNDAASTVYITACLSTFMAAVGRVSFSVLAVPIQHQFGLRMSDMGVLQSAMLGGYVLGQVRKSDLFITN